MLNNPYKGLVPYGEEDAGFFFGRDSEREIIIANLMASRLTLLYGPSGVGKSSLLRAGVGHSLRLLAHTGLNKDETPRMGFCVFQAWRDNPILSLQLSLNESLKPLVATRKETALPIANGDLIKFLNDWSELIQGDLFVILDQFEDYFLYNPHDDTTSFAEQFVRAVNHADLRISFLISIREDGLAKLDRFKGRIPNLFDNYLRMEHLNWQAAKEAIERPIDKYNSQLPAGTPQMSIEPALTEAVLTQVQKGRVILGEAGRGTVGVETKVDQIETPYLQLVMLRLWEAEVSSGSHVLRRETLEHLGNAEHIVKTHLDNTMSSLSKDERDIAARAFHYLVTPSGAKIAHALSDLTKYTLVPQRQLGPVLQKLGSGNIRILRSVSLSNEPSTPARFEIFHDVLAPSILSWRSRYTQDLELAERKSAAEARRVRLQRIGVISAAFALIALIVLFVFFLQQRRNANERAKIIRSLLFAEAATKNRNDLWLSALLAGEGVKSWPTQQAVESLRIALQFNPFVKELVGHTQPVDGAAFSPDGQLIVTFSRDKTARLWDLSANSYKTVLEGHSEPLNSAAFSPNGKLLVTTSQDGTARVWDVAAGKLLWTLAHTANVRTAHFSSDSNLIVTASDDYSACVWDANTGQRLAELKGHTNFVSSAQFSPDGNLIVTSSWDSTARIWNWRRTDVLPLILTGHTYVVNTAVFDLNGKLILTASQDSTARVWDAATGNSIAELKGHTAPVFRANFSPDGRFIVTASKDKTAKVWAASLSWAQIATLKGHTDEVYNADFNNDGTLIFTGSADTTVRVWDAERITTRWGGGTVQEWDPKSEAALGTLIQSTNASFSRAGNRLVTGGFDRSARLWKSRREEAMQAKWDDVTKAQFSSDGKFIVTSSRGSAAQVWDTSIKRFVRPIYDQSGSTLSRDGKLIGTFDLSHVASIWDFSTRTLLRELEGHSRPINSIDFSPDGKLVATASDDGTVRLWSVDSGQQVGILQHNSPVMTARFSPDPNSRYIVTASQDNFARIWDVSTFKLSKQFPGHKRHLYDAVFSSDGRLIATASADFTAIVWDVASEKVLKELKGHTKAVMAVTFSPDQNLVATASEDGSVRIWKWNVEAEENLPTTLLFDSPRSVSFSPDGSYLAVAGLAQDKAITIYPWEQFAPPVDLLSAIKQRFYHQLSTAQLEQHLPSY